jgi:serine/threonine protein kinase
MSPSLPLVGEDFAGYRLRSVLGRGGMGVVFEAENPRLGSVVALKVLAPELATDDLFRTRFLQESRVAASLNHPNVIPIYDAGACDGLLYIAMRCVAGRDLSAVLKTHEHISPAQALMLVGQAGRALDAAHRHGLVHRDVKPANILIERGADDDPDHVYLADFGITKHALSRSGLTATGQLVGTIDYIAPEQIQGKSVDGRADIYSLGCVLYECLTGRVPFLKDLDAAVIWAHVEELPTAPSVVRAELPRGIDDVIARALAKDPNDRYPTAREFIGAAGAALEAVPQSSGSASSEEGAATSSQTVLSGGSAPRSMPLPPAVGQVSGTSPAAGESHGAPPTFVPPVAAPPDDGRGLGGVEKPPGYAQPAGEPVLAGAAPPPAAGQQPPPASTKPDHDGVGGKVKHRWYAALLIVLLGAAAAVVILASSSSTEKGKPSSSALAQVPTNHVTGSGSATVRLKGDVATVTVTTNGLDDGAALVHAMHIHAGGKGECPPASAARLHNGHLTISTTDGINYYGPPVVALTTGGDTSPASILTFPRYLTGGTLHYSRTIALSPSVAADISRNNAVVVVHGIDYDGTGIYSGVLERSELNNSLPATATAPALCGQLIGSQQAAGLRPRAHTHALVYSASLTVNTAVALTEALLCRVGEGGAIEGELRRSASTGATA